MAATVPGGRGRPQPPAGGTIARSDREEHGTMSSVDLASAPVTPTPYGRWQPLNAALGLTGAGVSAIVCDPGEDFDIEHDEAETGQQEVYVVVAGRAEFTIGDERVEAAPGT